MSDNQLPDEAALERAVAQALDEAKHRGAQAAEASMSAEVGLSVNVRLEALETLEHHRDRGLGITVFINGGTGSASTSELSETAIRETVEAACAIARQAEADPCAGLAPAELMAAAPFPELDLYHPWPIDVDTAVTQAIACESAARGVDARIENSEGASLTTRHGLAVYGNSHGFLGTSRGSYHSLACAVVARDDSGMQRDFWYTTARAAEDLESVEAVGRQAGERTVARLGSRRIGTTQAPILFAPDVARSLFGHLLGAINGRAQYREASFLLGARGERLFPEWLELREEPHLPRGLGSAPFDDDGVATAPRALVANGVIQDYVLDAYAACRLGLTTTANAGGIHNLHVTTGPEDRDALLRRLDTGLWITELMGQGVNTVTGDYSRGAAGYWVQGGEIQYPVQEITIAGHLRSMLQGIQAVGSDVDRRGKIQTGSVLIDSMTIAGD
jgi:PmbA protein